MTQSGFKLMSRHDFLLQEDMPRVLEALHAVEQEGTGYITCEAFEQMCRQLNLRNDRFAFVAAATGKGDAAEGGVYCTRSATLRFLFPGHTQFDIAREVKAARKQPTQQQRLLPRPSTSNEQLQQQRQPVPETVEELWNMCSKGERFVTYEQCAKYMASTDESSTDHFLSCSEEMAARRAEDVAEFRKVTLADCFEAVKLGRSAAKMVTHPPLSVGNLMAHWGVLERQVMALIPQEHALRFATFVSYLKAYGAKTVVRMDWPSDLSKFPLPFTFRMEMTRTVRNKPRPPLELASVKVGREGFFKIFLAPQRTNATSASANASDDAALGVCADYSMLNNSSPRRRFLVADLSESKKIKEHKPEPILDPTEAPMVELSEPEERRVWDAVFGSENSAANVGSDGKPQRPRTAAYRSQYGVSIPLPDAMTHQREILKFVGMNVISQKMTFAEQLSLCRKLQHFDIVGGDREYALVTPRDESAQALEKLRLTRRQSSLRRKSFRRVPSSMDRPPEEEKRKSAAVEEKEKEKLPPFVPSASESSPVRPQTAGTSTARKHKSSITEFSSAIFPPRPPAIPNTPLLALEPASPVARMSPRRPQTAGKRRGNFFGVLTRPGVLRSSVGSNSSELGAAATTTTALPSTWRIV